MLAIVLAHYRTPLGTESAILSASGAAIVIASWTVTAVLKRSDPKRVVFLGVVLQAVSLVSLEFTITIPALAIASRVVQGIGLGLFLGASLYLAQTYLSKHRLVYLLGLYSLMVPLPYAFGPYLGKLYLQTFGVKYFYLIASVPAFIALLVLLPTQGSPPRLRGSGDAPVRIRELTANRRFLAACLGSFVAGLAFSYIPNYMAQIIDERGAPLLPFFFAYTASLLVVRLTFMRKADRAQKYRVAILGLWALALSLALCYASAHVVVLIASGVCFGVGHSIALPSLNGVVAEDYEIARRALPSAMFTASMNTGMFATPLVVFALSPWLSKLETLPAIALLCVAGSIIVGIPFVRTATGNALSNPAKN